MGTLISSIRNRNQFYEWRGGKYINEHLAKCLKAPELWEHPSKLFFGFTGGIVSIFHNVLECFNAKTKGVILYNRPNIQLWKHDILKSLLIWIIISWRIKNTTINLDNINQSWEKEIIFCFRLYLHFRSSYFKILLTLIYQLHFFNRKNNQ